MSKVVDKIFNDLKQAMLKQDQQRVSALRMLKSAIINLKISNKGASLRDEDVQQLIQKQIKQRMDAADQYKKASRDDLFKQEIDEKLIYETYLPAQMTDEQLHSQVDQILSENDLHTKKDFGKAMKLLQAALSGKADNRRISAALNKKLQDT